MRKMISLYSGCGGLDKGLEDAGFTTIFANDIEPLCGLTFAKNFPNAQFFTGNISEYIDYLKTQKIKSPELFEDVDLVAGGPPCPPFSKSRFYLKDKPRALDDPKAEETVSGFFDAVELISPKSFLFENVAGITFKSHQEAFDYIIERTKDLGYEPSYKIVNTADYGVPQIRQRFFLVGTKKNKFVFPSETHSKDHKNGLKNWEGCGKVLKDIDTEENASDEGHRAGGKHHHLLKDIPPGDNYLFFTEKKGHPNPEFEWRSRFWSFLLKLDPELPSWTIQARRSNNMGPFHWRNRILRILEVKRLQTFPDNWYLSGTVEQQWRQVGNAVPPLMAEILGKELLKHIDLNTEECHIRDIEKMTY
ncbi:DNA cytosine methyltransferase [Fluviicola sp.]|uniref:DNA cytosine methyltransferase n=1 Tax=Fluviicola sp. TaxID=1917219 RepID=UPI0031D8FB50